MGLGGDGLCALLGGSAAGVGCLGTTRFVGRFTGAVAAADAGGFVSDVFICVTLLGGCSSWLGDGGGALVTAGVPSLGLGHVS